MDTKEKNIAVILAGGSGSRFGADRPKQFLEVAGKMIIEHTIEAFHRHEGIDEIAIVTRHDYVSEVQQMAERNAYTKVRHVLCGGKERYHSTLAALQAYSDTEGHMLIHDAVRPLVTQRIITDCLTALREYDAVDVAVPTTDTIIELDPQGRLSRIPQRSLLRNVQTPQAFTISTLRRAFTLALQDPAFLPTDDISVVFRYLPDTPITVVNGDTTNIKITYPEDLAFAERNLTHNPQPTTHNPQ